MEQLLRVNHQQEQEIEKLRVCQNNLRGHSQLFHVRLEVARSWWDGVTVAVTGREDVQRRTDDGSDEIDELIGATSG